MVDIIGGTAKPKSLFVPKYTTTERDLLSPEPGFLIYDITQEQLCFARETAGSTSGWNILTSSSQS